MTLSISSSLTLPPEALTETFAVLGKRGSGKTNFAVVLVEELVGAGLPVVVIDPVGVWWGLRSSLDGKSAGLPVTILGGEHGDVPLELGAGAVIADFVVEARQPCVLDLSLFRKGEQVRFMTDFAERLYHAKATQRDALHVVVDEADAYAPQRPQPNEARLLGAMEDLVRRGRSRGLGLTLITQRPASLNKNVLTQAEVLVVFRMTGPHDRAAIEDWVKMNGDADKQKALMTSIAALPVGTAWLWSPGWLDVFQKVPVRARRTFDSSATPKAGAKRIEPRVLAPVDLAALTVRIAATVEKAKDQDPKALRARVKELEAQLAKKEPERVEVPVVDQRLRCAADDARLAIDRMRDELLAIRTSLAEALEASHAPVTSKTNGAAHHPRTREPLIVSPPTMLQMLSRDRALESAGVDKLRKGERTMLEALARHHPTKLTRSQLGTLAGLASGGGTFSTYLGVLKRHALVELVGELVSLTAAGLKAAGGKGPPMTRAEIVSIWKDKLRAGERRMLDVVLTEGDVSREDLASISAIEMSGGTFSTYLGVLKRNDLVITVGNRVRLGTALAEAS